MLRKTYKYLFILLLVLWIGGYGVFVTNILVKEPIKPLEKTDAIIVLTGGNDRIKTGLSLFSSGMSKRLFITGVHNSVNKNDIISMWQENNELPACCIILGHEAATTLENAYETKNWIEGKNIKTIRLVTSAYHMDRAILEFNNAIKNIKIITHPVKERSSPLQDLNFLRITLSEYNKIVFRTIVINLSAQG